MIVSNLVLRNFRNYDWLDVKFEKGINFIVGDNAAGKTNIVEAIHFLSLARSFRTSKNTDLIKERRQFATIEARVEEDTTHKSIVAILTPSHKKISCNGKPIKRISDLSDLINVIVFEPKDSLMFNDSPMVRRNFLDINLSKKSKGYLESLMIFEKLLNERNAILKKEELDLVQLEVVTDQLIDVQESIVKYRQLFVGEINKLLSKVIESIKGDNESAYLEYEPYVKFEKNYKQIATRAYEKNLESDIKHKMTQVGIHREDFKMILNGNDVSTYGSQGENRIAVIALKLTPYFLIEDKDKKPIIVLDDVMSELDQEHKKRLIKFLRKFEQVFITSTSSNVSNTSIYEVNKHIVTRRNA